MRQSRHTNAEIIRFVLILTALLNAPANAADIAIDKRTTTNGNHTNASNADSLAIAWDDSTSGDGMLRAMIVTPPWTFLTSTLTIEPDSILRYTGGRIYAVSRQAGTITVICRNTWTPLHVHSLGAGTEPQDIAVVSPSTAYVTRRRDTHLLRLNPITGAALEVVDLGVFLDPNDILDVRMMAMHEGRLFVQYCRTHQHDPIPEAALAVVDLATEQLIDVNPSEPGLQAIALQGTAPRFKMQIIPDTRLLFVSATGDFFDDGGIEMIDLDTLQSLGLVIRESDGQVGADLGAFVLVTPERGFLTFSTDLLLSSHLFPFTVTGGVIPGPQLHEALDYFVPTMVHDVATNYFFLPEGGFGGDGVHVFDALTGEPVTAQLLATTGPPTDLVLLIDFDCDGDGDIDPIDFLAFEECLSGPGGVLGLACLCLDQDSNESVDMHDFAAFQVAYGRGYDER